MSHYVLVFLNEGHSHAATEQAALLLLNERGHPMFQIFAGVALGYYLCFNYGAQISSVIDFKKVGEVVSQGAAAAKAVQTEAGKVIKTP